MNGAAEFVTRIGPARLAAMGVVALALVGFFAWVILRVSQPAMGVLFADLAPQEAGAILRELDARGIRTETRGDGGVILAPRADLARIRMELAAKGMPAGGVGYEIFDKGDAFSATGFVQGINHLRALEGELARSIRSIGRVQAARVHLVLPERRLFERDREPPRASIVLRARGEMEPGEVRAIRHLVASAVEGLRPERVSVVDERGRLLADGAGSDRALLGMGADERQAALERRLRAQVEEIVAGIVGHGRARVQVAAELDLSRVESRSETFDPESRVVRSTQTRGESQTSAAEAGSVSVGNELPGAQGAQGAPGPRDQSAKNEETVNYEISRTTRVETAEGGRVKRLSVAVVVDGVYAKGPGADPAYQPRSPEELDRIAALVRTAIGFDRARGDQVEVVNLRLAETPQAAEAAPESLMASLLAPTKEDVLRLVELGVIALLTLIVLLTVVRPMVKRLLRPEKPKPRAAAIEGGAAAQLEGPAGGLPMLSRENPMAHLIQAAVANGQIQADSLERIGELAKGNPQETVAVLRNWLHEK